MPHMIRHDSKEVIDRSGTISWAVKHWEAEINAGKAMYLTGSLRSLIKAFQQAYKYQKIEQIFKYLVFRGCKDECTVI